MAVALSGVLPLAIGAALIYWVMPQGLGVDTVAAYKLMGPPLPAVIAYYVVLPVFWVALCVGAISFELALADGTGRGPREQPDSVWRIIRSSLKVFGVTATFSILPLGGMNMSVVNVIPYDELTHVGEEARYLSWLGVACLLLVGVAYILSRFLARREEPLE